MKDTLKVESRVFRLSNILHYYVSALLTWGHSTLRSDSLKQQNFRLKSKYIVFPDNNWNNNWTDWKCIFATTQGAQPINNKQLEQQIPPSSLSLSAYHKAWGQGEHVGDGVLHGPRLLVQVDVPQHHAMHQGPQQEVDVTDQDHAQAHLHQGLGLLQGATTHPWAAI